MVFEQDSTPKILFLENDVSQKKDQNWIFRRAKRWLFSQQSKHGFFKYHYLTIEMYITSLQKYSVIPYAFRPAITYSFKDIGFR